MCGPPPPPTHTHTHTRIHTPFTPTYLRIATRTQAALDRDVGARYGLSKLVDAVRNTRDIGKKDMVRNDAMPAMEIDPETFEGEGEAEEEEEKEEEEEEEEAGIWSI